MKRRNTETLGTVLTRRRHESGRSRADAAGEADVSTQFAADLEKARYDNLSRDVYTLHSVRRYARVLGMEEATAESRYAEDRGSTTEIPSFHRSRHKLAPVVTSSILVRGLLAVVALTIIGYIAYQVIAAAGKPPLEVVFPRENQVVYTTEIELVGQTQPGNTITVDGRQITVADDGSFRYVLALPEGRHSVNVVAENDLGRTSRVTRHFIIEDEPD